MKTPRLIQLPRELEATVLRGILKACRATGIMAVRSNAGGGLRPGKGGKLRVIKGMPEGWPDITGWIPGCGRFLGIEAKAPGEKPTRTQIYTMRMMNASGASAFWTDSVVTATHTLMRLKTGAWITMDELGNWEIRD